MVKVVWTKSALKDLKTIYNFISFDSEFYAARLINKLISRVDQLEIFPDSGRMVPEKEDPSIREIIEGNFRIFYKLRKEHITILRIHHSARKIR